MSLFSLRLQSLRKKKGENQEDVAHYLGIQRSTYSGYERGIIVPPYEKIQKLASRYGVTVDYLMGQTNFENYDMKSQEIPDVAKQLTLISDELMSDTTAVDCNGVRMTPEQKALLLQSVQVCLNTLKLMTNEKEQK